MMIVDCRRTIVLVLDVPRRETLPTSIVAAPQHHNVLCGRIAHEGPTVM
jgi:hypothetical protein